MHDHYIADSCQGIDALRRIYRRPDRFQRHQRQNKASRECTVLPASGAMPLCALCNTIVK